jgi:DNA-nicking Smr family endonuclease
VERYIKLDEDQMSRYARAALEKSRKDKERVEREQKAIDDKIALEGRIRELCRTRLIAMLQSVRENTGKLVQTVTKENLATIKKRLSTDPTWKDDMDIFLLDPPEWVTDGEQFIKIVNEELPSIKKAFLEKAKEVMTSSLTILETALTNKDEAASLQKAEEDRQKAEDARKAEQARKDIDAQQAIAQMDQEKVADPRVKVAMKMDILDNEAWPQIFRFWYVNDPDAKTKDLIKKTFLQMKTFCEKWGNDNGEFVTHESIEWVEDVKAKR